MCDDTVEEGFFDPIQYVGKSTPTHQNDSDQWHSAVSDTLNEMEEYYSISEGQGNLNDLDVGVIPTGCLDSENRGSSTLLEVNENQITPNSGDIEGGLNHEDLGASGTSEEPSMNFGTSVKDIDLPVALEEQDPVAGDAHSQDGQYDGDVDSDGSMGIERPGRVCTQEDPPWNPPCGDAITSGTNVTQPGYQESQGLGAELPTHSEPTSGSEGSDDDPPRPPIRRSNRIRKGRKILTYGQLGVPKIQRYPGIFKIEYRSRDQELEAQNLGTQDSRSHNSLPTYKDPCSDRPCT